MPVGSNLESFLIKDVEKDKLYDFLREMEFNRLLSQAINFYGESNKKTISNNKKLDQIKST